MSNAVSGAEHAVADNKQIIDCLATPAGYRIEPNKLYLCRDWNNEDEVILVRVETADYDSGFAECVDDSTSRTFGASPEDLTGPMPSHQSVIEQVREAFGSDGELEIDEGAPIHWQADGVCEVQCWVWVSNDAADIESNDDHSDDERERLYLLGASNVETAAEFRDDMTVSLGDDNGSYVSGWISFAPVSKEPTPPISAADLIERQPSASIRGVSLNVPEFFQDEEFLAWLNNRNTTVFTWHVQGQPVTEWSDVIVLVDSSCSGEGDSSDMPEHLWKVLVDYCRDYFGVSQGDHYYLKLCNV